MRSPTPPSRKPRAYYIACPQDVATSDIYTLPGALPTVTKHDFQQWVHPATLEGAAPGWAIIEELELHSGVMLP